MTEYIYNRIELRNGVYSVEDRREEVVRCRDCKFYDKEWTSEAYRNRFWCGKMGHYMQPYGFCAWGMEKEDK